MISANMVMGSKPPRAMIATSVSSTATTSAAAAQKITASTPRSFASGLAANSSALSRAPFCLRWEGVVDVSCSHGQRECDPR